MAAYDSFITKHHDFIFSKIGINFYPWIGVNYGRQHRLLVVGKWFHDGGNPNGTADLSKPNSVEYGRETLYEEGIANNRYPYDKTLALLGVPVSDRRRFWSNVAFCNIAVNQRRVDDHIPLVVTDFQKFSAILGIINPTHILFIDLALRGQFSTGKNLEKGGISVPTTSNASFIESGNFIEVVDLGINGKYTRAVFSCEKKYAPQTASSSGQRARDFLPRIV